MFKKTYAEQNTVQKQRCNDKSGWDAVWETQVGSKNHVLNGRVGLDPLWEEAILGEHNAPDSPVSH